MTVACNLDLVAYPMDKQDCYIRIVSCKQANWTTTTFRVVVFRSDAYIAKVVNVTWFTENPILFNPDIGLPEFAINNFTEEYCNGTYRYAIMEHTHKTGKNRPLSDVSPKCLQK